MITAVVNEAMWRGVGMSDFIYHYPTLWRGTLLKRYKRFFADIELESGEVITAHCPNTGPMTGIATVGNAVYVSRSDDPKRKLAYTWEMIAVQDHVPTWAGTNTSLPNKVIKQMLEQHLIPELGEYSEVRGEVPYGSDRKSRIDFLLTTSDRPIYVEVKNTTWANDTLALFPDTVTTRGQKHLRELMALLPAAQPVMLYFINRGDCTAFAPGESADPEYGRLFRQAIAAGVQILPCRFEVSPTGLRYLGLVPVQLPES